MELSQVRTALKALRPDEPRTVGRYRLLGRLGSGGQGVVYLGEDPAGQRVAIKRLLPGGYDERARKRLVREVAAARRVAPFCTARVIEARAEGHAPFIVSEFIDGVSLQQQVREEGPLGPAALYWLALGTATALAAIHEAGVVHRDFKPANVMLAPDGPRVIDFGIARDLSRDLTETSRVVGTPVYMAPEQIRAEAVGPATDLFAWASVMMYAATGRAPFEAPHVAAVLYRIGHGEPDLQDAPAELDPLVRQCFSKDPAERPTAEEVVAGLLSRQTGTPVGQEHGELLARAAELVHRAAVTTPIALAATHTTQSRPDRASTRSTLPDVAPGHGSGASGHPARSHLVAGLAGVTLLVLGLWIAAPFGGRDRSPDATGTTTAPTTAPNETPAGSPSEAGAGNPTPSNPSAPAVPSAFAGTWIGTAYQPAGSPDRWTMRLELPAGQNRGRMVLDDRNCSGPVTVTSVSDFQVSLDVTLDPEGEGGCSDSGTVELSQNAFGRAAFLWTDGPNPLKVATGFVKRTD